MRAVSRQHLAAKAAPEGDSAQPETPAASAASAIPASIPAPISASISASGAPSTATSGRAQTRGARSAAGRGKKADAGAIGSSGSAEAADTASTGDDGGALVDGRVSRAQGLRQRRRTQILDGARALFAQRGYHETSIQDILDAAGIARGTFYLYFDSKRAIFGQLVDDFLARIQAVVTPVDVSPGAPPPLAQLSGNVERVMAVLQSGRDMTRIILRLAEGLDAECDAKMADFYARLIDLLTEAIDRGQRMGLVRPCDPRLAAHAALGGMKEVVLQWIVLRDSAPAEREHVAQEVLAFSLRGLFAAAP